MNKINVQDSLTTDMRPHGVSAEYKDLLPTVLFPYKFEFTINGASNAVANAIRRTIACELPVKCLICDYENIQTNDPFIIPELIVKRLKLIPIAQHVSDRAEFSLASQNKTMGVIDVKSADLLPVKAARPVFNETFTLFSLNPATYCNISKVRVESRYGYIAGDGGAVLGVNTTSTVVDVQPYDQYEDKGVHSSNSEARSWKISFVNNGTLEPNRIVIMACDNIIARASAVLELLHQINNNGDEYSLVIVGESDTIGNLLMKTICELNPRIKMVTYSTSNVERSMTLRIRCDDDINIVIGGAVAEIISIMEKIKNHF